MQPYNEDQYYQSPKDYMTFQNVHNDLEGWFNLNLSSKPYENEKELVETLQQTDKRQNNYSFRNSFFSNEEFPAMEYGRISQENSEQNIQEPKKQVQQKRRKCKVIFASNDSIYRRSKSVRGERFQTKNLCKHLYTQTSKHLKILAKTSQLGPQQIRVLQKFVGEKHKVSLNSFKSLFECEQIRQKCLNFFHTNFFVTEVMQSGIDFKNKLIFLKYLQKIRRLAGRSSLGKKWKD